MKSSNRWTGQQVSESLLVLLHGKHIAELTRDGQRLALTYTDSHTRRPDATPISVSMPTSTRTHNTKTVEPWLWGLLPDNDRVLQRWAREFQVSPRNVFALLRHVGEDCAGAIQFVRHERLEALNTSGITWLADDDVAEMLRELNADPTAWHQKNRTGMFSLAGAQAKIALHFDGTRWGLPHGTTPTTHILKPTILGLDDHDLNEHICLTTGRLLGLRTAATTVGSFGDQRALVVTRYDRMLGPDGQFTRLHQEDLCQSLSIHPDGKYQAEGGPTPKAITDMFRRTSTHSVAADMTTRFVDALAFNWLIAGTDAHAKNYSLLLHNNDVRLAPLYDIASALPYPDFDQHDLRLAMKVGKTYELAYIGRSNWEALAGQVGLLPKEVVDRVADLAVRLPDAMAKVCSSPALVSLGSSLPERLLDVVAARANACGDRLAITAGRP